MAQIWSFSGNLLKMLLPTTIPTVLPLSSLVTFSCNVLFPNALQSDFALATSISKSTITKLQHGENGVVRVEHLCLVVDAFCSA